MQKLRGQQAIIAHIAAPLDLPYLAALGQQGIVDLWNTNTGQHLMTLAAFHHNGLHAPLRFLANGKLFIAHHGGWTLYDVVHNKQTTYKHPRGQKKRGFGAPQLAISPNAQHVLACGNGTQEIKMFQLSPHGPKKLWSKRGKNCPHSSFPTVLSNDTYFTRETHFIDFSRPARNELCLRQISDGTLLARWPLSTAGQLYDLKIVADGPTAVGYTRDSLFVWDLEQPDSEPKKLTHPTLQRINKVALAPTGDKIATLTADRCVRLYHTRTGELLTTFEWDIGVLQAIAFSSDGLRAAVGSGRSTTRSTILVWDVE